LRNSYILTVTNQNKKLLQGPPFSSVLPVILTHTHTETLSLNKLYVYIHIYKLLFGCVVFSMCHEQQLKIKGPTFPSSEPDHLHSKNNSNQLGSDLANIYHNT
jgi:hypothetical protein